MDTLHSKHLAESIIREATASKQHLATAESCTGGLIGSALTAIPGSSTVFDSGYVTYSYESKNSLLGVPMTLIETRGAVSSPVAAAMAEGALMHMEGRGTLAVSVTGIAGPAGGTTDKPVGLVWFGLAQSGQTTHTESHIFEDKGRDHVRACAVETALELLLNAIRRTT